VRAYADSSVILRFVTGESGAEQAAAEYRRLGRPSLFYLPLHALEVENGIRQRAFHERRVLPSGQRAGIARKRDAALARLGGWVARGALKELVMDMDLAMDRARELSATHSEKTGARAIDLLHVACAVLLGSEIFLTSDRRQASLAKAQGLQVALVSAPESIGAASSSCALTLRCTAVLQPRRSRRAKASTVIASRRSAKRETPGKARSRGPTPFHKKTPGAPVLLPNNAPHSSDSTFL
jgi:predicted nucleic acid-binding protein